GRLAFFGSPREARAHFQVTSFADIYRKVDLEAPPAVWKQRYDDSSQNYRSFYITSRLSRPQTAAAGVTAPRSRLDRWFGGARSEMHQFAVLCQRQAEMVLRDVSALVLMVGQAPAIALMLWLVNA